MGDCIKSDRAYYEAWDNAYPDDSKSSNTRRSYPKEHGVLDYIGMAIICGSMAVAAGELVYLLYQAAEIPK